MKDWFEHERLHNAADSGDLTAVKKLVAEATLVIRNSMLTQAPLRRCARMAGASLQHWPLVVFATVSSCTITAMNWSVTFIPDGHENRPMVTRNSAR